MKLALFSDVHGRLRIVLHLMRCWQLAHRETLDGALIAGDLGCFPDTSKRDRATLRWIERDPEEAGFSSYFVTPSNKVQAMLDETAEGGPLTAVRCPILFVAGNHEDYQFLQAASRRPSAAGAPKNTFPIDCYGAFHCIRNGEVATLRGQDSSKLRVAGLWGIEVGKERAPYLIQRPAVEGLLGLGRGAFDLLLTHDAPFEAFPNMRGSRQITEIIRACDPAFHLFGHVYPADGRHEYMLSDRKTRCWIMEDTGFGPQCAGSLEGAMAVLDWQDSQGNVQLVEDDWLRRMRYHNWINVWP